MLVEAIRSDVGGNSHIEQVWIILNCRYQVECAANKVGDDDC